MRSKRPPFQVTKVISALHDAENDLNKHKMMIEVHNEELKKATHAVQMTTLKIENLRRLINTLQNDYGAKIS